MSNVKAIEDRAYQLGRRNGHRLRFLRTIGDTTWQTAWYACACGRTLTITLSDDTDPAYAGSALRLDCPLRNTHERT